MQASASLFRFPPLPFSLLLATAVVISAPALAQTTFTVDSTADDANARDSAPGDGVCSDDNNRCTLRAAVDEANATAGEVVINLPGQLAGGQSGTYTLSRVAPNIAANTHEDANAYGDLDFNGIYTELTLRGTGTPGPTVTVSPNDRIFHVLTGIVNFERITATGGKAPPGANGSPDGSGIGVDGGDGSDGGALLIESGTTVRVDQLAFSGNVTGSGGNGAAPSTSISRTEGGAAGDGGDGGAIANYGSLTVTRSTFSGNGTGDAGGAASGQANDGASPAKGGNGGDGGNGGAIFNAGTLIIEETTIADNTAGDPSTGAGGVNGGQDGYTGEGGSGGGIANAEIPEDETLGVLTIPAPVDSGTATLRNVLVASNNAGDDTQNGKQPGSDLYDASSGATFTSDGYNLVGTNHSVATGFPASPDADTDGNPDEDRYNANNDIVGTGQQADPSRIQPRLGSLNQNSDEAVQNRPLLTGTPPSPAIDRGANTDITGDEIQVDGRGFIRPTDGVDSDQTATVDIGSYESDSRPVEGDLVINEFDAVNPGNTSEFVEIENTGAFTAQLADYVLVLYSGDTACYSSNLQGQLSPSGLFVVGDPGVPNVDQTFADAFAYESCGAADGDNNAVDDQAMVDDSGAVAIYRGKATDYPRGSVAGQKQSTRVDVVVYDNSGSGGATLTLAASSGSTLCEKFGKPSGCAVSGDDSSRSIQRTGNNQYEALAPPTPGTANASPPPASSQLSITADSSSLAEGDTGTTTFSFTVQRSGDTTGSSSATYTTSGSGSNPAEPTDFTGGTFPTGTVSFAAGETTRAVTIPVAGDTSEEGDESFTVTLSNPSGATLGASSADATITNDDTGGARLEATKEILSYSAIDQIVTYRFTITNQGSATQRDNPGPELRDSLPSGLRLISAQQSSGPSGTVGLDTASNELTFDGSIGVGETVVVELTAEVTAMPGNTLENQADISFDGDDDGTNEQTEGSSDRDAATNGSGGQPTRFVVASAASPAAIPTLGTWLLLTTAILLGGIAVFQIRG